jgi:hypothetical protein
MEDLKKHIAELTQYMGENGVTVDPMPRVVLKKDKELSEQMLSPTGYYEPETKTIVVYVLNRHPKDVLRSYAHELIHHDQNMNGLLKTDLMAQSQDPKYAQNNEGLRKLEEDAFLRGNMMFRDWADNKKYK